MLQACLSDFARWRKAGWITNDQKLSLNISPLQLLLSGFADCLANTCRSFDLAPSDLILELNETSFMDRVLKGESVVQDIKAHGFALAIDDFGTGYSSIHALIQLEVDYLKIDTSLMRDIFSDPKGLAVVDSILAIGDHLNIDVIAVGVDHLAKINYLKDLGCKVCQGFVYARPMSTAVLEREFFQMKGTHASEVEALQHIFTT
jgi:EAL domain-containing protein (putative c-di-GMP-specific phosphodiesterase class I)